MSVEILTGDAVARLRELPANSVHCVVTSPPYWGLRDYGADGQIGLEPTPEQWAARLVDVFREVRRVLRQDGTLWLNCGDSYCAHPNQRSIDDKAGAKQLTNAGSTGSPSRHVDGLKPKDLIGQPWLLAFALRADGWWLRSEIIWAKPNPMPESVRDRPTKAHEQVFLLTKRERYFWDAEAVREKSDAVSGWTKQRANGVNTWDYGREEFESARIGGMSGKETFGDLGSRNARSVWTIATEPFAEAHFATFPTELARRCILAGTSAKGCCPACAAPWARVVEREFLQSGPLREKINDFDRDQGWEATPRGVTASATTGWAPTCACDAGEPVPATVLDPFFGSGTTGLVAEQLGRNAIGIELNPQYAEMARRRIDGARARRAIGDVAERHGPLPGQCEMQL